MQHRRCVQACHPSQWIQLGPGPAINSLLPFPLTTQHPTCIPACTAAGVAAVEAVQAPAPSNASSAASGATGPAVKCVDVAPPGLFSCMEQQAWGMCDALNATGFCAVTCKRCTPDASNTPCDNIATPDGAPCAKVRSMSTSAARQGRCMASSCMCRLGAHTITR